MAVIGERIRALRTEKGLVQKDLAKYLNLSKTTISHYEREDRSVPIDTLIKLANYFEVDINYILGTNNRGLSKSRNIRLSDEEVEFILAMRKTSVYQNMIINPKKYARLIEMKTSSYKIKI